MLLLSLKMSKCGIFPFSKNIYVRTHMTYYNGQLSFSETLLVLAASSHVSNVQT